MTEISHNSGLLANMERLEAVSTPFSLVCLAIFDWSAPRNPRPLGRGQGELSKNVNLPYREATPFRADVG
jgi:hypothetical protein